MPAGARYQILLGQSVSKLTPIWSEVEWIDEFELLELHKPNGSSMKAFVIELGTRERAVSAEAGLRRGPIAPDPSIPAAVGGAAVVSMMPAELRGIAARLEGTHPCDGTALAVLLGTPKLGSPPCFLAREISVPTPP